MSKDAQKAQKQRDNKTSRVVFSCIGVHLEIKTSVSWLKREKNQEHVKNFLDAKPLHFSSFITARCEDPLSADCNEITLLIWICICFLSGYRWTFWGHFSKNKLPFGCEKKSPSVAFSVKLTNCHLLAAKSRWRNDLIVLLLARIMILRHATNSCCLLRLCVMTWRVFGYICILDAFWISELHRAVKLSGACQCTISLMDSSIATLLWGLGFVKPLAIWFVRPFNLIAGMLSG